MASGLAISLTSRAYALSLIENISEIDGFRTQWIAILVYSLGSESIRIKQAKFQKWKNIIL